MRRLPDTILFSRIAPGGMSIRSPWLAMMMTVPCRHIVTITIIIIGGEIRSNGKEK